MLRCNDCKYQDLPVERSYPPLQSYSTDASGNTLVQVVTHLSAKLKARKAYGDTLEGIGHSCYQCGHLFTLDDVRWEGNSYERTWGGYQRREPHEIQTLRQEMMTRADNGNAEAQKYCEQAGISPSGYAGYAHNRTSAV